MMLTRIDDLTRGDHYHLEPSDVCYYFGEYTARQGFSFSDTNQLILNFKKSLEYKGTFSWKYKEKAIQQVASLYRALKGVDGVVFVPVPPSKAPTDPLFDDRMHDALSRCSPPFDVRRLVTQAVSRKAAHDCGDGGRPTINQLVSGYSINEAEATPEPKAIIICDDVMTTGATFKAMQTVLRGRFPDVQMAGVFVARRALNADDDALLF